METDATSIDEVLPSQAVITVGGEELTITPLKAREIPVFSREIQPMWDDLAKLSADISGNGNKAERAKVYVNLLAKHGEHLIAATAIACRKPVDFVGDLEADQLINLASKIMEVNIDFFVQTLLPASINAVVGMIEIVEARTKGIGGTSDKDSQTTGTESG